MVVYAFLLTITLSYKSSFISLNITRNISFSFINMIIANDLISLWKFDDVSNLIFIYRIYLFLYGIIPHSRVFSVNGLWKWIWITFKSNFKSLTLKSITWSLENVGLFILKVLLNSISSCRFTSLRISYSWIGCYSKLSTWFSWTIPICLLSLCNSVESYVFSNSIIIKNSLPLKLRFSRNITFLAFTILVL
jgi:hypothetical protein